MDVKEIKFGSDTKFRKQYFVSEHFSHPAKMNAHLLIYLVENYTKVGDVILDVMAGAGTLLLATTLERHCVLVELEDKFVKMQQDNWQKIKSLGPMLGFTMGEATILQGDARCLDGLLADNILFSPPYAESQMKAPYTEAAVEKMAKNWADKHKVSYDAAIRLFKKHLWKGGQIDNILFSPPYADQAVGNKKGYYEKNLERLKKVPIEKLGRESKRLLKTPPNPHTNLKLEPYSNSKDNISNLPYGEVSAVISSPPYESSEHNYKHGLKVLGKNFKGRKAWETKGKADAVITSPPYEGSDVSQTHMTSDKRGDKDNPNYRPSWKDKIKKGYCETKRPYADAIVTSPPYEASIKTGDGVVGEKDDYYKGVDHKTRLAKRKTGEYAYSGDDNNIGNLKSENYLEAMLSVYRQCHKVLKEKGLMVLVTKNFIRDKKIIRLDLDTIKLCEKAGFKLIEILKRKLTSQSFWRTIYHNKYPDVEKIEFEDVLVFEKENL